MEIQSSYQLMTKVNHVSLLFSPRCLVFVYTHTHDLELPSFSIVGHCSSVMEHEGGAPVFLLMGANTVVKYYSLTSPKPDQV